MMLFNTPMQTFMNASDYIILKHFYNKYFVWLAGIHVDMKKSINSTICEGINTKYCLTKKLLLKKSEYVFTI